MSKRELARAVDDGVAAVLAAHEDGLKRHAEILRRTVLPGFWGRLRWLLFGIPADESAVARAWKSLGAAMRRLKPDVNQMLEDAATEYRDG